MLDPGYRSPIPDTLRWRTWATDPEGITGDDLLDIRQQRAVSPRSRNCPPPASPGDRRRIVRDVFEDAYNYMKSGQLMRQVINKINRDRLQ